MSAYMAASNDGKLETLRAKNRPLQGAWPMRAAAVAASRFDRRAQSLYTFFRSPNLTMDSLFSTDQIEGRWKRLTVLL
jgi:hypothetical protein